MDCTCWTEKFIGLGQGTVGDVFSGRVEWLNNIKVRFKLKGGIAMKSIGYYFLDPGNRAIDLQMRASSPIPGFPDYARFSELEETNPRRISRDSRPDERSPEP
jgi:hypothetical protein